MVDEVYLSLNGLFTGEDHNVQDTSLRSRGGNRRLLSKFCCKRCNSGLKSPNTPTHLEVSRNGGAKVNAELAEFSSTTRQRRRLPCSFYPRPPRSFVSNLLLPFGELIPFSLQTNRLRIGSNTLFCHLWTIRLNMCTNDVDFGTSKVSQVS